MNLQLGREVAIVCHFFQEEYSNHHACGICHSLFSVLENNTFKWGWAVQRKKKKDQLVNPGKRSPENRHRASNMIDRLLLGPDNATWSLFASRKLKRFVE